MHGMMYTIEKLNSENITKHITRAPIYFPEIHFYEYFSKKHAPTFYDYSKNYIIHRWFGCKMQYSNSPNAIKLKARKLPMDQSVMFYFIFLIVTLNFSHAFDETLESVLQDHALKILTHRRPHTGALYDAHLPPSLSGIKVSVVGLRSRTLWRKGANFSDFTIPPKTMPVPYSKRVLIVYHNLGNWSSFYYTLSGYTRVSPVIGFLVYDASFSSRKKPSELSKLSKLELDTKGKPIMIQFENWTFSREGGNRDKRCAAFDERGNVGISEMSMASECQTRIQGHFSIVVPVKKEKQTWPFGIVGFLGGFVVLILVGFVGNLAVRSLVGKRSEEMMEKEADNGEFLQTYWIHSSKMPRAEVTRTQPVLESATLPNPTLSWFDWSNRNQSRKQ